MYAVAFIHNTSTGRIHVAYFIQAPFPGEGAQPCLRWRSRAHHTLGAETQEEADRHMIELREKLGGDPADLGHVDWDGEGIPAMNLLRTVACAS